MSEADALWFVGKLFLVYSLGWGAGMLVYAIRRASELL